MVRHLRRADLGSLFRPGDVVIANDAATFPASLRGTHAESGALIEVRLAAWVAAGDPTRFVAIALGPGDHRTPTEERALPPLISPGDHLLLGPLVAAVERLFDHPRLFALRFQGNRKAVLAGLSRHGRPIQYAHVPAPLALSDVWTSPSRQPGCVRAAISWICPRLAYGSGMATARHQPCHTHACGRNLVDRRSGARPAAAFRRTVCHFRENSGGHQPGEGRRCAHHRDRHHSGARD